ncbi:MAG: flagellar M-ring protein FliF [Beijerinckiaceae bacterium]|nr:flagellar M-ring protein FliF [Beijerinckiaceae bacterium]
MDSIIDGLKRLGVQRLVAMAAVVLILGGFFIYIAMRVTQPALSTLFTDLSTSDTNSITKDLEAKGIKYELRQDGATVLVPKDQVLKLRLELASKGLPAGGGIGYEIFDKGDNFSSTSFVQNVNHLRALEGELVRTIRSLDRVQSARVHLVLPERKLFSREQQEPRASIVLKVRGELDAGQIRAIRHLTASAVEGLKPERVSIVDEAGRLLADGAGNETDMTVVAAEKQGAFEKRLRTQIEDIIASVVGRGRARVQVAADIDFNRVQQTSETYDPESRVVRSTQTRNEAQLTSEAKDGTVSVSNELPAAQQQNNQTGANTKENTQKSEETINYEISRTTRTETIEGGRVKKLSVAVLVDGVYAKGADGEFGYQPRTQEEIDRIQTLVRTAMGYDKSRGDQLEVVNLRFAEAPAADAGKELSFLEKLFSFSKDDTLRLAELGVFAVLTLLVLFLVVRPLLKQVVAPEVFRKALPGFMQGAGVEGVEGQIAQIAPSTEMVEFSQLNGALKASTVDQVGQMVQNNPQETIAVLRNWIHGAA